MSAKGINEWYRAILSLVLLNMLHKTFDPVNEIILVCVRGSLLRSRCVTTLITAAKETTQEAAFKPLMSVHTQGKSYDN